MNISGGGVPRDWLAHLIQAAAIVVVIGGWTWWWTSDVKETEAVHTTRIATLQSEIDAETASQNATNTSLTTIATELARISAQLQDTRDLIKQQEHEPR